MFRSSKFLAVVLILILATTAFAFAATNTVPVTRAGEGVSVTTGYTVTNVVYHLNATTPSDIDSLTFTLNAAASNVQIRLVTTGSYYSCSATNAPTNTNWNCTTAGATVSAADELRVIATE